MKSPYSHPTHGLWNTRICRSWNAMKNRCLCKTSKDYEKYGGSGITICDFLIQSPANLLRAIGDRPPGTTIDRINPNGSYTCGKCEDCLNHGWVLNIRWATPLQQRRNLKIGNHKATVNGVEMFLQDIADKYGFYYNTILRRYLSGWAGDRLIRPSQKKFGKKYNP